MPNQRELEIKRPDLPENAEVFGQGLEDGSDLGRAKLIAGVISAVVLIGMLVTSLFRAPNDEWTALLAVVSGALIVVMSTQLARRRVDRRRHINR